MKIVFTTMRHLSKLMAKILIAMTSKLSGKTEKSKTNKIITLAVVKPRGTLKRMKSLR